MTEICDIYIDLNKCEIYKVIEYHGKNCVSLIDKDGNRFSRWLETGLNIHHNSVFECGNIATQTLTLLKTSEYEIVKNVCEAGCDFINWHQNDDELAKLSLESTFNSWLDNGKKYINIYIFSQKYFRENKKAILSTMYFFKSKGRR
jgi:hypothetical protein